MVCCVLCVRGLGRGLLSRGFFRVACQRGSSCVFGIGFLGFGVIYILTTLQPGGFALGIISETDWFLSDRSKERNG